MTIGGNEFGAAQRQAIDRGDLDLIGDAARWETGTDPIIGDRSRAAAASSQQDD